MSRWTAVLLAGSRPGGDPFAQAMGVMHKALIPVAGEAMILKPLRTLLASPDIARVLVLAQEPAPLRASIPASKRVAFRESEGTIAQTLSKLLANRGTQFPVVVTTADHALLDGAMLFEFLAKSAGADLAVGVVAKAKMTTWFPTAKRTWIPFRGDSFSGANL